MQEIKKNEGYGKFGNLSFNYHRGRKGFPEEVFSFIFSELKNKKPKILDLGCGTGISTEQLHVKGGKVIGIDSDPYMIEKAQASRRNKIEYLVRPAEKQGFRENVFDCVTAFSAFHWFANREAIYEIKKVLKPGGIFFVINKNETDNIKKEYRVILKHFIDQELPNQKLYYNPVKLLIKNKFRFVKKASFPVIEYYTLKEALAYFQSISLWNLVPEERKKIALKIIEKFLIKKMGLNAKIKRRLNIIVVSGKVNKSPNF